MGSNNNEIYIWVKGLKDFFDYQAKKRNMSISQMMVKGTIDYINRSMPKDDPQKEFIQKIADRVNVKQIQKNMTDSAHASHLPNNFIKSVQTMVKQNVDTDAIIEHVNRTIKEFERAFSEDYFKKHQVSFSIIYHLQDRENIENMKADYARIVKLRMVQHMQTLLDPDPDIREVRIGLIEQKKEQETKNGRKDNRKGKKKDSA